MINPFFFKLFVVPYNINKTGLTVNRSYKYCEQCNQWPLITKQNSGQLCGYQQETTPLTQY